MSFRIDEWREDLDLTNFYKEAEARGFVNNASRKLLIDSFRNEDEKQVWVLYYNDEIVGTVAAHSFPEMGDNAYRIAARTCVLTDKLKGLTYGNGLRGISVITKHQNPTAQFLIPACIEWAPKGANLYITSNQLEAGTQRRVHNIFGPALQKLNIMRPVKELFYRGTTQTVWSFDADEFYKQINKYPRWQ